METAGDRYRLTEREAAFIASRDSFYMATVGEIDEVLALFDGPIYGERSTMVLDLIDASAMLWRLHLRGIDVGDHPPAPTTDTRVLASCWSPTGTVETCREVRINSSGIDWSRAPPGGRRTQ
jgi:hypothetical protein